MKPSYRRLIPPPLHSFLTHTVQMKLWRSYRIKFVFWSFLTHTVQMKPICLKQIEEKKLNFLTHTVQMKLLTEDEMKQIPYKLLNPHGSDETWVSWGVY